MLQPFARLAALTSHVPMTARLNHMITNVYLRAIVMYMPRDDAQPIAYES